MLILIILVCGGLFLAYKFGGVESLDPMQQVQQFQQNVQLGAGWQTVVEKHPPKRYKTLYYSGSGELRDSSKIKFEKAKFETDMAEKKYGDGFKFMYTFTDSHAYHVYFDGDGIVEKVEKQISMSDLMGPPKNPFTQN
jgi:hypothetical protein